jgi:hypothetical protein
VFKRLEAEDRLPKFDTENLIIASINMVGVAVPPDPSKYPQLKASFSHFSVVIGGSGGRSVSNKWKKMEELSEESGIGSRMWKDGDRN